MITVFSEDRGLAASSPLFFFIISELDTELFQDMGCDFLGNVNTSDLLETGPVRCRITLAYE